MLERIIYYLNKYKVATIDDLVNAPSISNGSFDLFEGNREILPKEVVVGYCSRLAMMGYIYSYRGIYKLAQKIPQMRVTDIYKRKMDEDEKLLYLYNRIHSIGFPNGDIRIQNKLSMLEMLHLMQFMRVEYIAYFDFWKLLDKQFRHVYRFAKDMEQYGYIYVKNYNVYFTGKYIPYSVKYTVLIDFNEESLSEEDALSVERVIEAELDIIDTRDSTIRLKKEFNVPALEEIAFVKSYINEFDRKGQDRLRMIQTLYDSLNVFK